MTRKRTPSLSVSEKYVFVILVTWSFKWCSYVIWVLHVVSIKPHQISSAPGFWLVISQRASLHVLCCREVTRRTAPCSPASAESLMRHVSLTANKDYTVNGRWLLTGFLVQEGKHFFPLTCLLTKCDFWSSPRFTRVRISTRPFPPSGIAPGIESKSHFLSHTGSDL